MMNARDWRDVEMTSYVKVSSSEDQIISFSVRGGFRSGARPCEASSYKVSLHYTSGTFVVVKERYFQGYANMPPVSSTAGPLDHWVGVKFVTVNRVIAGKHCVLLEVWIDQNNSNSWIKRYSKLDDGNDLCPTGTACGSNINPCQIINWGGPMAMFEIATTSVSLAKCSIREISYDGSFGSTPPPPPPTSQPPPPPPTPPEEENQAAKFNIQPGNITASSNDGNVPANTYDNNLSTRWAASPIPQWIKFDLGAVRRVSGVGVHWYRPVIPDPPPPPPPTPPPPTPPGTPPSPPPPPPGQLLENGVRMLYPRKSSGGSFYFSSSNPGRSQYISELNHCFVNLEVTGYLFIHDVDNNSEEVSIKVRGSCHGCNSDDCGRCYIIGVGYNGSVNAQYEEPHPKNHEYSIHGSRGNFNAGSSMVGRWFGIKAICFLQGNHDHLECWLDTDGLDAFGRPMNSWRRFWQSDVDEFTGHCNSSGCDKGDLVFFRMDDVSGNEEDAVDLRFATAREIII